MDKPACAAPTTIKSSILLVFSKIGLFLDTAKAFKLQ
jgi:hypothetical protein